jgi:hypothetical protein
MGGQDRIITTVLQPRELTAAYWEQIWILTQEFFEVQRDHAESELRMRQRIALFHMNGALLGMVALDVLTERFRGRALTVITTTHVLLRENWRGRNLLQRLGWRTFLAARLRHPLRPIYWFFDTSSYKSYLLLPRNFRHFWPRHDRPTPPACAALIDQLAVRLYGAAWRPDLGVVMRSGERRLRESAAPLILTRDSDPNLAFFSRANPGHPEGDMLLCLCPLTLANWLSLANRAFRRFRRRSPH